MFRFGPTTNNDIPFDVLCQATARTALATLRYSGHPPTPRNLKLLLVSAPRTKAEVQDRGRREASFCRDCLEVATERTAGGSVEDKKAVKEARLVFLQLLPMTTPATRCLVETAVLTLAPVFSRSPVELEATAAAVAVGAAS